MWKRSVVVLCLGLAVAGCSDPDTQTGDPAPWVKTHVVGGADGVNMALTGTVRARNEVPLSFRVAGQVIERRVDAGARVRAGQLLFRLDPRDLEAGVRAADAERAAAAAALATAASDTARHQALFDKGFISRQLLERVQLSEREVRSRADAATSRWQQARNAAAYGAISADAAGVLMEVGVEPGQVVAPGQTVAVLARDGEREVEVFVPEGQKVPATGVVKLGSGDLLDLRLREVAGALDPVSRTWRARYQLIRPSVVPELGSIVSARFEIIAAGGQDLEIPLGALDERGQGARVWRIVDGKAQPQPVAILVVGPESARVRGEIPAGTRLIALGTHLLKPGMAVRELTP